MPIHSFWAASNAADKIEAANSLNQIRILGAMNSEEAFKETVQQYSATLGTVVWQTEMLDKASFARVKRDIEGV